MTNLAFHELLDTETPASLGPDRRAGTLSTGEIDQRFSAESSKAGDLLRALIYLWHDHLDASHKIAQEIETGDGSLVHAIMHRRETDYWNSKYWFRRAGKHPAFLKLAVDAEALLARAGETDLLSRLVPNKTWDPFAFVDAVEDAAQGQFKSKTPVLEELQKLEFAALLDNFAHRI